MSLVAALLRYRAVSAALSALLAMFLVAPAPLAARDDPQSPPPAAPPPAMRNDPQIAPPAGQKRTVDALSVVRLRSKAVADARSNRTLGPVREGTGVVIDPDGLVLTIGYLILEAETVELSTADGTAFPATVVGYDSATGFGLLKSLRPLPIRPIQFGQSSDLALREPVLIVGFDGVAPAMVVSRRQFVGYWEYLLDEAIYTAPATVNWSGAALLSREGKLLGIGSLSVNDAVGSDSEMPGNLFVPIDLLKPLLKDLIARGKSSARPRPWIGVQTQEFHGNVVVTRVSPDSPADEASMRPGDVIVRVGNQVIKGQADFYSRLWSQGAAGAEIPLDVLREGRIQSIKVKSIDRDRYYRVRRTF
jgi:S1-C subfamily serine protease